MPRWIEAFVRFVDALNYRVGRFSMYLLFVLMGVLLWSSLSNIFRHNSIWTLETAQFVMVAYYMLGGPYSLQLDSNVRMDLLYHRWTERQRAWVDAFSVFALIFYLGVLLYGGLESTAYSLGKPYDQGTFQYFGTLAKAFFTGGPSAFSAELGTIERSATAWRPYIWPIKTIMCIGIVLMILQTTALFFKDIAKLRGEEI